MRINRQDLLEWHDKLTKDAFDLMKAKNADYATDKDVFRNFRTFGLLGVLVRMSDKLARLRTFEEREVFNVTDESLQDTVMDLINYSIIFYAMSQEGRGEDVPTSGL